MRANMNLNPRTAHLAYAAVALALAAAAMAGCSDGDGPEPAGGASPPSADGMQPGVAGRPPAVPASAEQVESATTFAPDSFGSSEILTGVTCEANVLTIESAERVVYAALPCDRALPPELLARFAGKAVRIEIESGEPAKLFLRSAEGESAEFTVDGVWVEEAGD